MHKYLVNVYKKGNAPRDEKFQENQQLILNTQADFSKQKIPAIASEDPIFL